MNNPCKPHVLIYLRSEMEGSKRSLIQYEMYMKRQIISSHVLYSCKGDVYEIFNNYPITQLYPVQVP